MAITLFKSIGAIILSLVVALMLLAGIEGISAILHPFPDSFGGTSEEMIAHVANYPTWVLALLGGLGWALTMFVSVYLATRLSANRHPAHGYGVGALLIAAAIFNISMLPYPLWFIITDTVLLPAAAFLGTQLGRQTQQSNS